MEDGGSNTTTTATAATTTSGAAATMAQHQQQQQQQQQQQLFQQQLFLLHQYQQHQQQHQNQHQHQHQQQQHHLPVQPHPQQIPSASPSPCPSQPQPQPPPHHHLTLQQQQQAAAISRFPSNIDAHLRPPGLRSLHFHNPTPPPSNSNPPPPPPSHSSTTTSSSSPSPSALSLHHQIQQQNQAKAAAAAAAVAGGGAGGGRVMGNPVEVEMAHQDALKVCNPDVKRPFSSVEDAVLRLLPYHVVSDYEAEEDDRILDSDTTGQIPSRLQQWDHNILAKIAEFTTTFEKQALAFNIMSRKRAQGEFRSEERLMIEQALLQEEKQALLELRAEIESREKANREAAEAKLRMAMVQAEQARAEAQAHAHAEMISRAPMRASAIGAHADEGSTAQEMGQEQGGNMEEMIHGWGNNGQRDDEEPEDFLNDENEPENGDGGLHEEWREAGELDLNTR